MNNRTSSLCGSRINWKLSVLLVAIGAVCSAAPASAQDLSGLPKPLAKKILAAQQACTELDDGQFALEFGAVHRLDLDGDLYSDWVLDEAGFACSSAASMYCGAGGCVSHFLIGDHVNSLLTQGWDMANIGPQSVLLANVHYSQCGGISPSPCVVASVWDDDEMMWRSTEAKWQK